MLNLKFLFSLFQYIIFVYSGIVQKRLFDGVVLHIDRLTADCRGNNVSTQGFFQGVKTLSTSLFIGNYTLVVKQGGLRKIMLTITIVRCRAKENLDTCEQYHKQPNINFCTILSSNNLIAGKIAIAAPFVPPLKCPISKGIYHAYNFTYDLTPFIFFELEDWYWKIFIEMFSPDRNGLVYCSHMDGYVTNSKPKRN